VLALHALGGVLGETGDRAGALQAYRDALQIHLKVLGPGDARTAISEYNLGNELAVQGDHAGAEPLLAHAVELLEPCRPKGDSNVAIVRAALGTTQLELAFAGREADPERAVERAEAAVECLRRSLADHERNADALYARATRMQLGAALTALGAAHLASGEEADSARGSFAEAEELLTGVYGSVRGTSTGRPSSYARPTLTYAAQWLVRLYEIWQTIEPGEPIATKQREWTAHWREVSRS
jgi:tetratricopeptide (TPR) repeat protein